MKILIMTKEEQRKVLLLQGDFLNLTPEDLTALIDADWQVKQYRSPDEDVHTASDARQLHSLVDGVIKGE